MIKLIDKVEGVCGGRPTVVGTRIEVRHIKGWSEQGMSVPTIAREYRLTEAQVNAALQYNETRG